MLLDKELYDVIVNILSQISTSLELSEITPEMSLINDLSIDSIKVAELSILLENQFQYPIFIPDLLAAYRDPYDITVEALVSFVTEQLSSKEL